MQYLITALDGKNLLERRMAVRPQHLRNMAQVKGKILCAGGILDTAGMMKGSVLVMDFESRAQLDEYLASEPYIQKKVWESVDVQPMNVVILDGRKVGG